MSAIPALSRRRLAAKPWPPNNAPLIPAVSLVRSAGESRDREEPLQSIDHAWDSREHFCCFDNHRPHRGRSSVRRLSSDCERHLGLAPPMKPFVTMADSGQRSLIPKLQDRNRHPDPGQVRRTVAETASPTVERGLLVLRAGALALLVPAARLLLARTAGGFGLSSSATARD